MNKITNLPQEKLIGLAELSKLIGFSENSIRRMVTKKQIPYYKILNRYRFKIDEINKWLRGKKIA